MEDQNRKTGLIPFPLLWGSYQGFAVFYYQASTRKDCKKTKHRAPSPWETVRNLSVFTLRNVLATEEIKKHSSHAGMTNGCFRAGESVITESSSPTMRQMWKKLTRNMLRDALSLSQNWNCGNKYKRGLYICEYIHIIYIIYIYYVYINTNRHSWKQNAPFWLEKKNSFARQNNKQKVSGVYVFIHIYIYTYIHIKSYEWMNQTFPVSSRRSKFVQRLTLNKYIFFLTPMSGWYYCTMVIEMYVIYILYSIYSILCIIRNCV